MVETGREYVLQWSDHAASITERFSGLLARQALVDVTLLCQNQQLRVHKLVLASCSLYFEEMLEQDLGQEPTIILNDLHFNILKAMIEFMYCGETTIAHCHLQSLLNAAQLFKVKHLESLVISMIDAKIQHDCDSPVSCESNIEEENSFSPLNSCTDVQSPENDPEIFSSTDIFADSTTSCDSTHEVAPIFENNESKTPPDDGEEQQKMCDSPLELELSPKLDENHENHLTEEPHEDQLDPPGVIGQCSRVYTHKKRKSLDNRKSQFLPLNFPQLGDSLTTDCIDLSYDKTCDISPVTLTSIDLEPEYIFSLNSESIHPTCHLNPPNSSIIDRNRIIYDDLDNHKFTGSSYKNIRSQIKELFSDQNQCHNMEHSTPVLRRSVRLNQLENDDTVNNNNNEGIKCQKTRDYKKQQLKELKKFSRIKSMRLNRRNKNSQSRISDENRKHAINSRCLRSRRKIVTKSRSKFSLSSKEEQKTHRNTRLKGEKIDKMESMNNDNNDADDDYVPLKLNTIASVDRSLWGDMSDLLENCHNNVILPDNSQSKEIPFAVGLLPLRAALERMQAIPDYQPRKTRSSVAPYKVDSCGAKRKANGEFESIVISKKQCSPERAINESDTVCHIQIHTSPHCSQSKIVDAKRLMPIEPTLDKR